MTSAVPPNSGRQNPSEDSPHVGLVPQDEAASLPEYLTAREVAKTLRTTAYYVATMCKSGELRAIKPGKAWLIEPAAVREYLDRGKAAS